MKSKYIIAALVIIVVAIVVSTTNENKVDAIKLGISDRNLSRIVIAIATTTTADEDKVDITRLGISDSDWNLSRNVNDSYTLEIHAPQLAGKEVRIDYTYGYTLFYRYPSHTEQTTERIDENGSIVMIFPSDVGEIMIKPRR